MAKEVILPEGSSSTSSSCGASSISGFSSSSRLQRHHSGSAGGGRNASTESLSYIYDAGIPRCIKALELIVFARKVTY